MITSLEEPMLIIALESLDEDGQYRHINHAQQGVDYYCPCCHEILRARAVDKNKKFLVQPHFYHLNGGCKEESYIHWLCKTWMLVPGTVFFVNNKKYEVAEVDVEKPHKTSYGIYQPDTTVLTTTGETFYIEFFYSNQKNSDYLPKWDELGNVVLEGNARQLVSQKYVNGDLQFKIIYKDGYCYCNPHLTREYSDIIEKRKREWKRQDILNYKAQWEKLDWFWSNLCRLIEGNIDINKVLDDFSKIDISDKEMCYSLLSKHKVIKGYEEDFRKIINNEIINYWNEQVELIEARKNIYIIGSLAPRHLIHMEIYPQKNLSIISLSDLIVHENNRKRILSYSQIQSVLDTAIEYENTYVYLKPIREEEYKRYKHKNAIRCHRKNQRRHRKRLQEKNLIERELVLNRRNIIDYYKNNKIHIDDIKQSYENVKALFYSKDDCIWEISNKLKFEFSKHYYDNGIYLPDSHTGRLSFYIKLKNNHLKGCIRSIHIEFEYFNDYNEMFLISDLMNAMEDIINEVEEKYSGYNRATGKFYPYRKIFIPGGKK